MRSFALLVTLSVLCCGCASYVTPGGPARLEQINRTDVAEMAVRRPAAQFPARLAIVRLQAADYGSFSTQTYGGRAPLAAAGRFRTIIPQELLTDAQIEAASGWPAVAGFIPLTSLTMPTRIDSVDDLRVAGAKVQADILLVYTIDTAFRVQGKGYGPLTAISLGTIPDRDAYITATASAILLDVRSGFVYGVAEATAKTSGLTNVWSSRATIDRKRIEAEQESFARLVDEAAKTWRGIVKQYN